MNSFLIIRLLLFLCKRVQWMTLVSCWNRGHTQEYTPVKWGYPHCVCVPVVHMWIHTMQLGTHNLIFPGYVGNYDFLLWKRGHFPMASKKSFSPLLGRVESCNDPNSNWGYPRLQVHPIRKLCIHMDLPIACFTKATSPCASSRQRACRRLIQCPHYTVCLVGN